MFKVNVADPSSVGVNEEEDAKLSVPGADLLRNVDISLPARELYQLGHSWNMACSAAYDITTIIIHQSAFVDMLCN